MEMDRLLRCMCIAEDATPEMARNAGHKCLLCYPSGRMRRSYRIQRKCRDRCIGCFVSTLASAVSHGMPCARITSSQARVSTGKPDSSTLLKGNAEETWSKQSQNKTDRMMLLICSEHTVSSKLLSWQITCTWRYLDAFGADVQLHNAAGGLEAFVSVALSVSKHSRPMHAELTQGQVQLGELSQRLEVKG